MPVVELPAWSKASHGTRSTYDRYGCRCDDCKAANRKHYTAYRRRKTGECQEWSACGKNSGYAHGCRGDACGLARVIWQREKRGTKHPGPSKYDTPTPPEVIALYKQLFRPRG